MARARNIKAKFFSNADLVELPMATRLLFIGLWCLADREGRLEDRPKQIRMEIFPADDVNVDQCLASLAESNFILRYDLDGRRFIQVANFRKHQHPHYLEPASVIPPPGGVVPEVPTMATDDPADGFEEFWLYWPKKVARSAAIVAWGKLRPDPTLRAMIAADVESRASSPDWMNEGGKFIPYPATYLNGRRWEDQSADLNGSTETEDPERAYAREQGRKAKAERLEREKDAN